MTCLADEAINAIVHFAYYSFHKVLFDLVRVNRYDTIWMVTLKQERV